LLWLNRGSPLSPGQQTALHSKWRKSLRDLKGFIKFVNSTKSRAPMPGACLDTPTIVQGQGQSRSKSKSQRQTQNKV